MHHITSQTIPKSLHKKVDVVVGLDARGFLIGPIIALRLGAAFVPVRKRGKLPGECVSATYEKEYGTVSSYILGIRHVLTIITQDTFEMQSDAVKPGQSVIVVDDLIATGKSTVLFSCAILTTFPGGSAKAAGELVKKQGGVTIEYLFIIEVMFFNGYQHLDAPVYSIIQTQG